MTPEAIRRYPPGVGAEAGERGTHVGSGPGAERMLIELIAELTDYGTVWPLKSLIDNWGREQVGRVVADGFAVVRKTRDTLPDDGYDNASFLPTEDALVLLHHLRKREWDDYRILAGPWGPIHREDEPDLISSYAADDPEAVSEIRRRHADLRAAWERRQPGR
jgi:hypothetical protein